MKTNFDPRHLRRIRIIKALYSQQFISTKKPKMNSLDVKFFNILLKELPKLNQEINRYSLKFGVEKMAKIDLSILQLGTYELLFQKQVPSKVVMDEAIELAKEFGSEKSPSLINGILAKIYEQKKANENA